MSSADNVTTTYDPYGVDHSLRTVNFFWGVASGGTHAALWRAYNGEHDAARNIDVPTPGNIMVSYATQENGLWPGPTWMIDSGGAPDTIKANGGHDTEIGEYVSYLREPETKYSADPAEVDIGQFALRDWPCEPGVRDALDLSVSELQQKTLEDHIRMLDRVEDDHAIDAQPVAVLQGWEVDDYLDCIDLYRDHGLLTDTVGIGSVCRKNTPDMVDRVHTIGQRVRRNLPARVDLHGFGLKRSVLDEPSALRVFDSVDSAAWEFYIRQSTRDGIEKAPPSDELAYADWVDWDDRGNPRYTWRNIQTCFAGYHRKIAGVQTAQPGLNDFVLDISEWHRIFDGFDRGDDGDGYPILKCVCGTVVDPGRPDPMPEPGCRFCERSAINLWDRRMQAREESLAASP